MKIQHFIIIFIRDHLFLTFHFNLIIPTRMTSRAIDELFCPAPPTVVVWTVFNHGVIPLTRDRTLPFVQVNVELRRQCDEKTVMKLLEEFALAKHTGLEKPGLLSSLCAPNDHRIHLFWTERCMYVTLELGTGPEQFVNF